MDLLAVPQQFFWVTRKNGWIKQSFCYTRSFTRNDSGYPCTQAKCVTGGKSYGIYTNCFEQFFIGLVAILRNFQLESDVLPLFCWLFLLFLKRSPWLSPLGGLLPYGAWWRVNKSSGFTLQNSKWRRATMKLDLSTWRYKVYDLNQSNSSDL